ncbi:MAG: T9SS type A sorting domain-containing protein [Chitinophagales bacterium]
MGQLRFLALTLLLFLFYTCSAQNWEWAKNKSNYDDDHVPSLAIDRQGNVYLPITNLLDDSLTCTAATAAGYLLKYGSNGACIWSTPTLGKALVVAADSTDNLYVLSSISDSIFVTKMDLNGQVKWDKLFKRKYGLLKSQEMTVSGNGTIFIAGEFGDTLSIDTCSIVSSTQTAAYAACIDSDGICRWLKKLDIAPNGIASDAQQNIYLTGFITDTVLIEGNTVPCLGGSDIVLCSYDKNGALNWVTRAGSDAFNISARFDGGNAIAVSPANEIFITGNFIDTAYFDSSSIISNGGNDIFVAKYSNLGNVVWVRGFGANSDDEGYSISADNDGNCYVGGRHVFYMEMDGIGVPWLKNYDLFVAKLNSIGSVERVSSAVGKPWNENVTGLAASGTTIFATGVFYDTAYFGLDTLYGTGVGNIFLAKVSADLTALPSFSEGLLSVYPNPSTGLLMVNNAPAGVSKAEIHGIDGRLVSQQEVSEERTAVDVSFLPNGVYLCVLTNQHEKRVARFVKQE